MGIVMLDNKVLMSGNQMALYIPSSPPSPPPPPSSLLLLLLLSFHFFNFFSSSPLLGAKLANYVFLELNGLIIPFYRKTS